MRIACLLVVLATVGIVHSYNIFRTDYFDHGPADAQCGLIAFAPGSNFISYGVFQQLSLPVLPAPYYYVLRGAGIGLIRSMPVPVDIAVYTSGTSTANFTHPVGLPLAEYRFTAGVFNGTNQYPADPSITVDGWNVVLGSTAQNLWAYITQPPSQALQMEQSCRLTPNPDTGTGPLHRLGAILSIQPNSSVWADYGQNMTMYPWNLLPNDPFTTSVVNNQWRPKWWLIVDIAYDDVPGSMSPSPPPRSASLTNSLSASNSRTSSNVPTPTPSPSSPITREPTPTTRSNAATPSPFNGTASATPKKRGHHGDPINDKKAGVPIWGWVLIGVAICCTCILCFVCIAVIIVGLIVAKKKHDADNDYG